MTDLSPTAQAPPPARLPARRSGPTQQKTGGAFSAAFPWQWHLDRLTTAFRSLSTACDGLSTALPPHFHCRSTDLTVSVASPPPLPDAPPPFV